MKHYFFLFLMICFCPFYVMGQDDSSVKMTELIDESQLVDGGIYIMTAQRKISGDKLFLLLLHHGTV